MEKQETSTDQSVGVVDTINKSKGFSESGLKYLMGHVSHESKTIDRSALKELRTQFTEQVQKLVNTFTDEQLMEVGRENFIENAAIYLKIEKNKKGVIKSNKMIDEKKAADHEKQKTIRGMEKGKSEVEKCKMRLDRMHNREIIKMGNKKYRINIKYEIEVLEQPAEEPKKKHVKKQSKAKEISTAVKNIPQPAPEASSPAITAIEAFPESLKDECSDDIRATASQEELQQITHYKELFDEGHKYHEPHAEQLVSSVNDFEGVVKMAQDISRNYKKDVAHSIRIAILRTAIRGTVTQYSDFRELKPAFDAASRILLEHQGIVTTDYIGEYRSATRTGRWGVMTEIETIIIKAELAASK